MTVLDRTADSARVLQPGHGEAQPAAQTGGSRPGALPRRLNPQDNFFLLFETEEAPLNVSAVGVFEGKLQFGDLADMVRSKMHLIPRYRQRVIPAPFGISRPTWEDDPQFDLTRHIKRLTIDPPGTHDQLMDLTARLSEGRLDRGKPLWELTVIEGLENDQTAVFSKVHHCLVDGVSGVALLLVTMDVVPDPPPTAPAEPFEPAPVPDATSLFLDGLTDNVIEAMEQAFAAQRSLLRLPLTSDLSGLNRLWRGLSTTLPYVLSPRQRAPFNGPLSGARRFATSEFPFNEIRSIRNACGGTINDVVLAVVAGALGRYLELHGSPMEDRDIRVMTPVNVRSEDPTASLGNQISALVVPLPVGIASPVDRLEAITRITTELKDSDAAGTAKAFFNQFLGVPPSLLSAFLGMQPPNTLINMACTNVPGPMIPLYSAGHRMIAAYPMVPLAWEMGLGCAVTSYDQRLYFGLVADAALAPDVAVFKRFLDDAYGELKAAAGIGGSTAAAKAGVAIATAA